jgi:23S rRNA (pseudouridine1915-N3)-methyltransferase
MRKLELFAVGRLKEAAIREICDDYYKRCRRTLDIREREFRSLQALEAAITPKTFLLLLDERGEQWKSRPFAAQLDQWSQKPGRPLVVAIGGADGFTDRLRNRADKIWGLSKLTFAHRLVRVIVAEQLFRAVSIIEGTPYHRD